MTEVGVLEKIVSIEKVFDKDDKRRYEVANEMIEKERKINYVLDDAIKAVVGGNKEKNGYEANAQVAFEQLNFLQKYTPFGKAEPGYNEAVAHLEKDVGAISSLKIPEGGEKFQLLKPYILLPGIFGVLGSSRGLPGFLAYFGIGLGLTAMMRGMPGNYRKQYHYLFLANSRLLDDKLKTYATKEVKTPSKNKIE